MNEILDFIENSGFQYVYGWIDKKTYAIVDHEKQVITINMELIVVDMFLHEFFHSKYEISERAIIKKTGNKLKRLKVAQIQEIAAKIFVRSKFTETIMPGDKVVAGHRNKCKMTMQMKMDPKRRKCKYRRGNP